MISNYTGLLNKLSQAVDIYSSVNRYLHLNKCKSIKRVCSIKMHLFSKSFLIFVIVWGILFDYQRIIFNSHENGQRIRKCQTVQNHYIPHAFK